MLKLLSNYNFALLFNL